MGRTADDRLTARMRFAPAPIRKPQAIECPRCDTLSLAQLGKQLTCEACGEELSYED